MSGPEQPWWVRPGGAPPPAAPPGRPDPYRAQPPPRRADPARWLMIGGAVGVVVLIAAGAGVWALRSSSGTRLDVHRAEAGVAEILSDPIYGYGANDIAAVACNNGRDPEVEVGATFICAVDINDTVRQVTVEFTDDDGTYAVDGPR